MSGDGLVEIAKRHALTGEHAGRYLRVAPDVITYLHALAAEMSGPPAYKPVLGQPRPDGLPIVVDTDLPAGGWRLLEVADGAVVQSGQLAPRP